MAKARKPGKDVTNWKEQMAAEAEVAAGVVSGIGTSNFFSLKGGRLSYNDDPMPNNEMAVVVVDFTNENSYYDVPFDSDNPASPVCFAFGKDASIMKPHPDSPEPQHDTCKGCPHAIFGSADVGRGKACRNSMRVGMTPAGTVEPNGDVEANTDPDYYETSDIAILKVPPTSLKGFAKYVRDTKGIFKRAPFGVITHVKVVPDDDDQFHVGFIPKGLITDEMGPVIVERLNQMREMEFLEQPYQPIEEPDEPPSRSRKTKVKAKKKTGRGKRTSRY